MGFRQPGQDRKAESLAGRVLKEVITLVGIVELLEMFIGGPLPDEGDKLFARLERNHELDVVRGGGA